MRDWLATLWPASFRGTAFLVERDREDGGRRIVNHLFPHRDDPFNEDMGDDVRLFHVNAYLASDSADGDAAGLTAALSMEGPGILVLPSHGPINARAQKPWSRCRERDRAGYIAFEITFVREGVEQPATSANYLANLALTGVDALAGAIGAASSALAVIGQPGWIVDGLGAQAQDIVASLDAIRTETPVDPTQSGLIARTFAALYQSVPLRISPVTGLDASLMPDIAQAARDLGAALPASSAVSAFASAIASFPPPPAGSTATVNAAVRARNIALMARLARLSFLTAYVEAVIRADYESRPAAVHARRAMNALFEAELDAATGAANLDLFVGLQDLRGRASAFLSYLITSLAPVLTVTSVRMLPSLVVAWALYQDCTRAPELVVRNRVRHPSFMPLRIEAIAP